MNCSSSPRFDVYISESLRMAFSRMEFHVVVRNFGAEGTLSRRVMQGCKLIAF